MSKRLRYASNKGFYPKLKNPQFNWGIFIYCLKTPSHFDAGFYVFIKKLKRTFSNGMFFLVSFKISKLNTIFYLSLKSFAKIGFTHSTTKNPIIVIPTTVTN